MTLFQSFNLSKRMLLLLVLLLAIAFSLLTGCAEIAEVAEVVGVDSGLVNLAKSFEDFTPQQEYYIGRTVSVMILDQYPTYENSAANAYLNLVGQSLALASDMPEIFGGYHFLILDSDDINAFAAPGGFIFVTRGMLRCARHEDALAAILAHEIGHVQTKHGLQAIKKSRITGALTNVALTGVKTYAEEDIAELTSIFEDSIFDITTTLIEKGYSRAFEKEADLVALTILQRLGYDPNGMVDMLNMMNDRLQPGGLDFAKTHPDPEDRIAYIQELIGPYAPVALHETRQQRFRTALEDI